jgi:hypothetical protein
MRTIDLKLPMLNTSVCRSCGAAIDWYETTAGKKIPMNAGAAEVARVAGFSQVAEFFAADSHFATCPQAKHWSKR